jgi:hypothetical protein
MARGIWLAAAIALMVVPSAHAAGRCGSHAWCDRRVKVKLAGLPKGRYRVRIVTRTSRGRRLVQRRTYRTCAKKRPAKRSIL